MTKSSLSACCSKTFGTSREILENLCFGLWLVTFEDGLHAFVARFGFIGTGI